MVWHHKLARRHEACFRLGRGAAMVCLALFAAGCGEPADRAGSVVTTTTAAEHPSTGAATTDTKPAEPRPAAERPAEDGDAKPPVQADPRCSVVIVTAWSGASAAEVEAAIARPVEQVLQDLADVAAITSISRPEQSQIVLELAPMADLVQTKRAVAAVLRQAVPGLPDEIETPQMMTIAPDAVPGIWLVLTAANGDADPYDEHLSNVAEQVRRQVQAVPLVVQVRTFGQLRRELLVSCDPAKLAARGVTLAACVDGVQSVAMHAAGHQDLADAIITASAGRIVRLRDVATVRLQAQPDQSLAWLDGRPSIALGVFVDGEEPLAVCQAIERQLADWRRSLPTGVSLNVYGGSSPTERPLMLAQWWLPPQAETEQVQRLVERIAQATSAGAAPVHIWWQPDDGALRLLAVPGEDVAKQTADWRGVTPTDADFVATTLTASGPETWRPRYPVQLALLGPDSNVLGCWTEKVLEALKHSGFDAHALDANPLQTSPHVELDRDRTAELAVQPEDIVILLQAATGGIVITPEHANAVGEQRPTVRITLNVKQQELANIPVATQGKSVRLGSIATIRQDTVPSLLYRRDGQRAMLIVGTQRDKVGTISDAAVQAVAEARAVAESARLSLQLPDEYLVRQLVAR